MATKKAAGVKAGAKASKAKASEAAAGASKSTVKRFRAVINRKEGGEVCAIDIPFDVEKTFGGRDRVPVCGTLNGAPYRSSVFRMGGDCHFMVVNRQLRAAAGVTGGETVPVTMERDDAPRVMEAPADFARALKGNKDAQATWDKLSYTHRREHVQHVEDAKKPETRQRRIEKSIQMLAAGKKELR
ncbi:MAG TPA: YdeI/OmpD-associated family protein [Pyrinomonadaceae bacterium]|jgi:hypothetical protein|nr:YdeI/OmpD-associated family protein [Pyrinomonadaceae bacterium]